MHELNSSRIREWWEMQARREPASAGMLTVFGADELSRVYRQEAEWRHFRQIVRLRKGMHVLELGCGAARWSHLIAPYVTRVTAVDFSGEMIKLATERGKQQGLTNLTYHVCPVQEFGGDLTYDLVYLSGVDQYLNEAEFSALATRVVGWLKPNGMVVDRVTLSTGVRFIANTEDGYQCVYRTAAEIETAFKRNGLDLNYRAPSHRPPRISRLARSKFFASCLVCAFRASPALGLFTVRMITGIANLLRPQTETSDRSHDFLRFVRHQTSAALK